MVLVCKGKVSVIKIHVDVNSSIVLSLKQQLFNRSETSQARNRQGSEVSDRRVFVFPTLAWKISVTGLGGLWLTGLKATERTQVPKRHFVPSLLFVVCFPP